MTPGQWRKIHEIFEAALERPVDERAAYLAHACAGEEQVRKRVEAMLDADARDDLLVDRPAYEVNLAPETDSLGHDDSQGFSGLMIGAYRLEREIGRGGMGTVYLAYDTRLRRQAALKFLPSRMSHTPDRVRRFQREARAASALNHPNIITIYDIGHENGHEYIASEYVEGRTLRDFVASPGLPLEQILDVAIQVTRALEAAHSAGIVHRDIKPENIMRRPDGYVKVVDFGLAKLIEPEDGGGKAGSDASGKGLQFETRAGILLGTVNYMSPEQARGHTVDGRSDLFSLGVVIYELISGCRPFEGPTWNHTLLAIMDEEPPPIAPYTEGAPDALQQVISRALAKDRELRYQSARELLADLERLQGQLGGDTRLKRVEGRRARKAKPIRKHTAAIAGARMDEATGEVDAGRVTAPITLVARLQQHRGALLIFFLLVFAAAYLWLVRWPGAARPALTGKDTILIADFTNTTGDAVFDGTLKQGLAVQLEQSPYFNIFPEERARETLRLMERHHDEKITREVGREICLRRGVKALLVGTIASLGRNYVITLEAVNSQSGEAVAHQQTEAEGKEQVLKALGRAATEMREKLGESLASIRKFDVPIEQATTASLEAFKDFTDGIAHRLKGEFGQSVTALKRAIEQDKEFALAHSKLGTSYRDLRNLALGNQHLERAYQLRDRVSERERLEITATYFRHVTGELDKRIESTSLLSRTYPQYPYGYHLHGNSLMIAGEFEQAAEAYRAVLRLDADFSLSRANLALALIGMNRFDEAHEVIEEGLARKLDSGGFRNRLYLIAFYRGDAAAMAEQVEWFTGKPDEYQIREMQARTLAFSGRRRQASDLFAQAVALAESRGLLAEKARILANEANLNALFGMIDPARKQVTRVLVLLADKHISSDELQPSLIGQLDSPPLAWTLALCGETKRALAVAKDLAPSLPLDTLHKRFGQPLVPATLELQRGASAGALDKALQQLQLARPYEAALSFRLTWMRGQMYLQEKNGALAAAEFQRIIDHRGWDVVSTLWPLAHLGLARAAALQGDAEKSRRAYESFFQLWKEADPDLPILIEARTEYERLP